MPQQKSTSFSAAKVANFGVVMAEMMGKVGEMEKEIKRLRHHVSVLSKRNHQLMKDGKSRAVSPIASDTSLSEEEDEDDGMEVERGKGKMRVTIVATEEELEDLVKDAGIGLGLIKGMEATERVVREEKSGVVAESVALVEEAEVAEPVVRLPVAVKGEGSKKRRVDGSEDEEEEVEKGEEVLIAPLGPRAECGSLLRRVGRESVFAGADPRYVAGGGPSKPAPVGLSRGTDAWRQRPGGRGGYLLRPRGGGWGRGYGGMGRGRGV